MSTIHESVLLSEVLTYLDPQLGEVFVDCTFGGGGHALAILDKVGPKGKVIGIDWDPRTITSSRNNNLILVNDNYKNLKQIINDLGIDKIDGILLDLGLSSDQLGAGNRGFSFQDQGLLDLRYNQDSDRPRAIELLNNSNQEELETIFKNYGEDPLARLIAQKIIAERENKPIAEVAQLAGLVEEVYRHRFRTKSRRHPATRVFQALRIAVNDEFGNLQAVLPDTIDALASEGRLAVISFHSGEDRIVKHFFKIQQKLGRVEILTKKPIMASAKEINTNPRSRSAKLRVVKKII